MQIPTEDQLMEQYRTSRNTVRADRHHADDRSGNGPRRR
jgi:hypothetical protein